jgi:hypothetical protein
MTESHIQSSKKNMTMRFANLLKTMVTIYVWNRIAKRFTLNHLGCNVKKDKSTTKEDMAGSDVLVMFRKQFIDDNAMSKYEI